MLRLFVNPPLLPLQHLLLRDSANFVALQKDFEFLGGGFGGCGGGGGEGVGPGRDCVVDEGSHELVVGPEFGVLWQWFFFF